MSYAQYPARETITASGDEVRHLFSNDTHWIISLADGVTPSDVGDNVEACSLSDEEVEAQAAIKNPDADYLATLLSPPGAYELTAEEVPVAGEGLPA